QAELIYVGKDSSTHTVKQEEINRLLANNAKAGKTVVRLKGGDPFVFGRGGEEAEFLSKEGIEVDIIPGVTSAVAVPAYAGIPVTHRSFCSSFGIITGHEDPQKAGSSIKWDKISTGLDTIVFLMGVTNLPNIVHELIKNGRDPSTPVAMIRWGTRSSQETLVGTLEDIVEKVKRSNFKPPAVTVVGEVVNLREKLRWFDNRPLFGKKILINRSRSRDQESRVAALLEQFGAKPIEFPTFITLPLESFEELDAKLDQLEDYDWLFFTSAQGVQFVLKRLRQLNKDIRWLKGLRIGAIGNQTAEVLEKLGLIIDFQARGITDKQVIQEFFESIRERRILFFSAHRSPEFLPDSMGLAEARIEVVMAYRTEIENSAT
ncbi:MAG: uroporphyrinogen-III C-methyltransferase, partial [Patescibacteria group bacterium]|nr:uroporphyrinogen-III C-methyltransferase [Patescibacteria group bacterium]